MNKAKLTTEGARRLRRQDLAGKYVDYDGVLKLEGDSSIVCAGELYYNGKRLGRNLAFTGDSPGLIDPAEAWRSM